MEVRYLTSSEISYLSSDQSVNLTRKIARKNEKINWKMFFDTIIVAPPIGPRLSSSRVTGSNTGSSSDSSAPAESRKLVIGRV